MGTKVIIIVLKKVWVIIILIIAVLKGQIVFVRITIKIKMKIYLITSVLYFNIFFNKY